MLQKAQRCLKLGYALHCSENSQCTSHCTVFALSNAYDTCFKSLCEHEHSEICDECSNVFQLLDSTSEIVLSIEDTAKKGEMIYDANLAQNFVMNWMRHILRGVQQNKSKTKCMNEVNSTTSFWLKDWAQKVIPTKYQEAQKDYFGKRGMSLHIDVFFYKEKKL